MAVATQKKTTALRGSVSDSAGRHFDLTGDWPVVRGIDWDDERYLTFAVWKTLTEDEQSRLTRWMVVNGREIRLTRVRGADVFEHYPVSDIAEINTAPTDRVELCVDSDSIRHSDVVSIVVLNAENRTEAEAIFRQWLEDVSKHLTASQGPARLTA